MANPNLASISGVYAKNAVVACSTTTEVLLVSNAASSGKAMLIDGVVVANAQGGVSTVTLNRYEADSNTGTAYPIVKSAAVPNGYTLSAVTKDQGFSLLEGQSIYVSVSSGSAVAVHATWKELS